MFEITVSQTGIDEVIAMLQRAARIVEDPIALAREELIAWFRAFERRQFASEGAAGNDGRWPRLSKRYAIWKARRYPGTGILVRTGRLMRSLVSKTGDSIVESSKRKLELGSLVPYAAFHQRGTARLPRRAPLAITNRDAAEVVAIIRRRVFSELEQVRKVAA